LKAAGKLTAAAAECDADIAAPASACSCQHHPRECNQQQQQQPTTSRSPTVPYCPVPAKLRFKAVTKNLFIFGRGRVFFSLLSGSFRFLFLP